MTLRWNHFTAGFVALTLAGAPASAQLFIYPPDFSGPPVTTLEPDIALPLPGATPDEVRSSLIWNLRAGLNVAPLQCQFSPFLGTVRNYNQLLRHQAAELDSARASLERYFKRVHSKAGPRAFDQYTTRTYNNFSTLYGQLGFCQTAAQIGRAALATPKGSFYELAVARLREFRNSLRPVGDRIFSVNYSQFHLPRLVDPCLDKKGRRKKRC